MIQNIKRQTGISLMEVISSLLIMGLVVAGALALFGNADSSQKTNQMQADVTALRAAIKGLYTGQGGYGAAELNTTLKAANKIPSDLSVDASTPPVITHTMNGTVALMGATTAFTITLTSIPTDVCVGLLTNMSGSWTSAKVGAAAAISTFPIPPATAASATNCSAATTNTIVLTAS
jgi:type II secretory pathway pseudopilin PulG